MKKTNISQRNKVNTFIAFIVVALVASVGAYYLTGTHAATLTSYQILNSASAAQTVGVTTTTTTVGSIGIQNVSQVAPGAQLDYLVGGKSPVTQECYFVQVLPLKGGGTTAKVEFVGPGRTKTVNLPWSTDPISTLQQVCVGTGTGVQQPFNVLNLSPVTGPDVLVYEDVVAN